MSRTSYDERTLRMMDAFPKLHSQGYSIYKIAAQFGLEYSTVYRRLGQIVERYNNEHPDTPIDRNALLQRPRLNCTQPKSTIFTRLPLPAVDPEAFHADLNAALTALDALIEDIAQEIFTQEVFSKRHTGG